jgi:hypothetical protein
MTLRRPGQGTSSTSASRSTAANAAVRFLERHELPEERVMTVRDSTALHTTPETRLFKQPEIRRMTHGVEYVVDGIHVHELSAGPGASHTDDRALDALTSAARLGSEARGQLVKEIAARPDCFEFLRPAMDDPIVRALATDVAVERWKSLASRDGSAAQSWKLGRWLADCCVGRNGLRDFASDGAWCSRSAPVGGLVLDGHATTAPDGGVVATGGEAARFCAALGAQRLRFQFHFAGLREFIAPVLDRFPDDSLFLAMHAFARAGMRDRDVVRFVDESLACADCDRHVRHVCLHALQFADYLPDQPDRMLVLARDMERRGEQGGVLYYRAAYAHRRLAEWDEALKNIDTGIALLVGNSDLSIHQDFVRERVMIEALRDVSRRYDKTCSSMLEVEANTNATQQFVARSAATPRKEHARAGALVNYQAPRATKVLGICRAIITFVAGIVQILAGANHLYHQSILAPRPQARRRTESSA